MFQQSNLSIRKSSVISICIVTILAAFTGLAVAQPVATLSDALGAGRLSLDMRYRLELVSQDGLANDAAASTARIRLGYESESFNNFTGYMDFEMVTAVGDENYDNTSNANTNYPVVPDREDAELNQAYINFSGIQNTNLILGRQRVDLDNARFIGDVGWRQNEQTFDAAAINIAPNDHFNIFYAHIENVNSVFGAHHPVGALSDIDVSSEIVNVSASALPGKLSAYWYMIDFTDTPASSHQNMGARFAGKKSVGPLVSALYSAEWAKQSNYKDGATTIDANYFQVEAGVKVLATSARAGLEVLSGDGTWAFQTPLATLHNFNGWADMFLTTPPNGLSDMSFSLGGMIAGVNWNGVYHSYKAETGSAKYGTEFGVELNRNFTSAYMLQLKFASYSADTFGTDTQKFWTSMSIKI